MKEELIKTIKELYLDYLFEEGLAGEDTEEQKKEIEKATTLGLMFTEVGYDNEYQIQVSYDLVEQQAIVELTIEDGVSLTYKEHQSLEDFAEELECATFDGYYSWAHGIVIEKFKREDIEF